MRDNPLYEPSWSEKEQRDFLDFSYTYYRKKHGDPRPVAYDWFALWRGQPQPNAPKIVRETVGYLYRLGRDLRVLAMAFDEFWSWLTARPGYGGRGGRFYENHGVGYRERLPKVGRPRPSPEGETARLRQSREDWREGKGFRKDRARQFSRPYKKWAKKFSNREHRRWEARAILNETTDELFKVKPKHYFDPWYWD